MYSGSEKKQPQSLTSNSTTGVILRQLVRYAREAAYTDIKRKILTAYARLTVRLE